MVVMRNWDVRCDDNPYTPPECQHNYLHGEVFNHPDFDDGMRVYTSYIVDVQGRQVTTYSGTVYLLEDPNPDYIAWCEKRGCHIPTAEVPILFHKCG